MHVVHMLLHIYLWSYFNGLKVVLFIVESLYSWSWLISVLSMTEQTTESHVGLMSQLPAGQRLTLTSIWSLGEGKDAPVPALWSAPGAGPSRRTSCDATGTSPRIPGSNVWWSEIIQCNLFITNNLSFKVFQSFKSWNKSMFLLLNWPDKEAYLLALCWLLIVQRCFECNFG